MIDTESKLNQLLPKLQRADWVALDTEADSLHAYPEKLCLLQISIPGSDHLIDTLAGLDLSGLLGALHGRELILHGADYDLRLLRKTFGFVPWMIFDTMWAARLLGYDAFSLTDLVARHLGIALEKGPQKMNWAKRPLPERMEKYARNDTHYLQPVGERLRCELVQKGRLSWLEEVCADAIKESAQVRMPDPDTIWRIKGSDRLPPQALAVLKELWAWREEEAVQRNKPPYFIMSHEKLVHLSSAVSSGRPIEPLLPRQFSEQRQLRISKAIERALQQSDADYPRSRRIIGRRLTQSEMARFTDLRNLRDRHGAELQIDPTIIASRAMLVALAQDWDSNQAELMHWQRELLNGK